MGEDVYDYRSIRKDDLLYLKEGTIHNYIEGELENVTLQIVEKCNFLGIY